MQKSSILLGCVLVLSGVTAAGCSDDDGVESPATGGSMDGTGGSDEGTGGSDEGTGGSDEGTGGSDDGTGGMDEGTGGSGEGADDFAALSVLSDVDVPAEAANDLRALGFAATGELYAAGAAQTESDDPQLALMRFLADGTVDTSFGDEGVVHVNLVDGAEQARALVVLPDGDVLVAATITDGLGGEAVTDQGGGDDVERPDGQDAVIVRFNADGERVASFGTDGMVPVTFGWSEADTANWPEPTYDSTAESGAEWSHGGYPVDTLWDMVLDNSGDTPKVVVFGVGPAPYDADAQEQRLDNDRYIVRLLAEDGSADPAFNGDGSPHVFDSFASLNDNLRRGMVEADGAIVSGGYTNFGEDQGNHVVLIRLLPDGTPDPEFGFGFEAGVDAPGVAKFNPFLVDGGMSECYGVAQMSDGSYVTTGYGRATGADQTSSMGYATTDSVDLVVFGLTGTGLSADFAMDGALAVQSEELALASGTEERGRAITVLADDRAVHVGRFAGEAAIYVTRPDGSLDTDQGEGGIFSFPHATLGSQFFGVALAPGGKHVATATNTDAAGARVVVLEVAED